MMHAPLTLPEDESSLDAGLHFLRQMFNIALQEEYKRELRGAHIEGMTTP